MSVTIQRVATGRLPAKNPILTLIKNMIEFVYSLIYVQISARKAKKIHQNGHYFAKAVPVNHERAPT
ncbi:hypothetical protein AB1L05_09775 [Cytobacillus horneckiae]